MARIAIWGPLQEEGRGERSYFTDCDCCDRRATRFFRDNVSKVALCTYHANRIKTCTVQMLGDET